MSGVVLLYGGWHVAAARVMPVPVMASSSSSSLSWFLVGVGFAGLFAVKSALQRHPHGRLADALYPWLFSGLYLDERFTRLTFRIWPPRLQPPSESTRAIHIPETLEARV